MLLSGFHVFGAFKAAKKRYKLTHKIVLAVLWPKILLVLHWPKQYLAILWQGHTFCPAWFPLFRLNIFRLVRWNVLCWVVALICLGGFEILAITFLHNLDICLLPNKKSCKIIKHVSTVVIKILDCVKLDQIIQFISHLVAWAPLSHMWDGTWVFGSRLVVARNLLVFISKIVSTSGKNWCSIPVRWQRRTKGLLPKPPWMYAIGYICLCIEP